MSCIAHVVLVLLTWFRVIPRAVPAWGGEDCLPSRVLDEWEERFLLLRQLSPGNVLPHRWRHQLYLHAVPGWDF